MAGSVSTQSVQWDCLVFVAEFFEWESGMNTLQSETFNFAQILHWLARAMSVVSIFILLLFVVGEGFNPLALRAREWTLMIFFPIGVIAGMAVAWGREGLGGAITVVSLIAFYLTHLLFSGGFPRGWAFVAFASPGFLFLAQWLFTRDAG